MPTVRVSYGGHEERFPPTKLSACCGFRKETIAGMCRNGRNAPISAIREVGDRTAQFDTNRTFAQK